MEQTKPIINSHVHIVAPLYKEILIYFNNLFAMNTEEKREDTELMFHFNKIKNLESEIADVSYMTMRYKYRKTLRSAAKHIRQNYILSSLVSTLVAYLNADDLIITDLAIDHILCNLKFKKRAKITTALVKLEYILEKKPDIYTKDDLEKIGTLVELANEYMENKYKYVLG